MFYLHLIHYIGFSGAQVFNSILVVLILKRAASLFGPYRHVMLVFTLCSMLFSWVEIITQPVLHQKGPMFVVFLDHTFPDSLGHFIACIHCATFGFLISVLATQFFYRYCALCKHHLLAIFHKGRLFFIFVPSLIIYVGWYCVVDWGMSATIEKREYLKEDLASLYNIDSMSVSFIAPLYWTIGADGHREWRYKDVISSGFCITIIFTLSCLILFFGFKILIYMRTANLHMSARTLDLNRQLFIMLSAQVDSLPLIIAALQHVFMLLFWKIFIKLTVYGGAIVSLVLNSILLLLILFRSPASLGNYKYLMLYIVIFQMTYSVLDVITEPIIISHDYTVLVFRNFKSSMLGREETVFLLVIYCGFFGFSIALFAIHFIYRYGVSDKTFRDTYLSGCKLIVLFLMPAVVGTAWTAICYIYFHYDSSTDQLEENLFLQTYDTKIKDVSYVIVLFYKVDKHNKLQPDSRIFFAIGCLWALVILSMFCVFYFGIKCYLRLTRALPSSQLTSNVAKSIQHQLFVALVFQTTVPVVLLYIPFAILLIFPMLNMGFNKFGSFLATTVAIYPAIDPLPTIFIVKNFRDTLLCRTCGSTQTTEPPPGIQLQPVVGTTTVQTN